jgi:N-hydroxyarylamine O-acetyltransferase
MDVASYLNRINYYGRLDISVETLTALHRAHMLAVPFENLDIHLDRPILLEEPRLLEKIVDRRRGGFCYELNGAFAWLLRTVGFDVEMLEAEVRSPDGVFGPPFDHMTLLVNLEQRWLADVGFGDSFLEPLLLDERRAQVQQDRSYRVNESEGVLLMETQEAGSWTTQHRFSTRPYRLADFAGMCRFHQTSPDSIFTQRRTCTLATSEGRITLTGRRLITTTRERRNERELKSAVEYRSELSEQFGVDLSSTEAEKLFAPDRRKEQ